MRPWYLSRCRLPGRVPFTSACYNVAMRRIELLLTVVGVLVVVAVVAAIMLVRPVAARFPDAEGAAVESAPVESAAVDLDGDPASVADAAAPAPQTRVDPTWVTATASAAGIPERPLLAYAAATLELADRDPTCGVGWATLAAIGWAESAHGSHEGATMSESGVVLPGIHGIPIGSDTDGGAIDGDPEVDRAVGPLQFIPDTWERWGSDGDADGLADPHDIDDAALTAARYLCAASGGMTTSSGWDAGIAAYNPDPDYRDRVAAAMRYYVDATS